MNSKKLISVLLALVLALSLSVPAMAAAEDESADLLTRGELLAALYGLNEDAEAQAHQEFFDDVPADGDLARAIHWAVSAGVVNGYGNGKFGPDDPITREQAAAMLYRCAQAQGKGFQGAWMFMLDYPDADQIAPWADEAMHWAVLNGIVTATDAGLEPKAAVAADQLPLILERWQAAMGSAAQEDGQNPVMNFIGTYSADRATALVEAKGAENARITIEWGDSAWSLTRWVMSGPFDADRLTVEYTDCVRTTVTYSEDGTQESETTEYENGTGRIVFGEDGSFTWASDQDEQDLVFAWSWEPAEIDYLVLVNKTNPLPRGWEAALETVTAANSVGDEVEVETKAYDAYLLLKADLEENDGIWLELDSARRSVAAQQDIMERFTEKYGADYAAKTVAQPGYSEHHTGLALDLYFRTKNADGSFTDVYYNEDMEKAEYQGVWEKIHEKLADYGFILRYPEGKEHITGYRSELWHIRYVGDPAIAAEITAQGLTLEEYLAGKAAPEVTIDYGESALYTPEELRDAVLAVKCQFAAFAGCELHSIRYVGDACNSEENLSWVNEQEPEAGFVQVAQFLSDFHSPVEDFPSAWEIDREYTDWGWTLARAANGGWELVNWGYGANIPEQADGWTREGYFEDENGNQLYILRSDIEGYEGWSVSCVLDEDAHGWIVQPNGDKLYGDLNAWSEEADPFFVTVSAEGEDGIALETADGTVYHFLPKEMPTAAVAVNIGTSGIGEISYAAPGEELTFDDEYPYTSAYLGLEEAGKTYTFGARTTEPGWFFVKWTKDGENFSTDATVTLELNESAEYVAVFNFDPFAGDFYDPETGEAALQIGRNADGTYHVEIGIYRLTNLDDGVGTLVEVTPGDEFNEAVQELRFTATDANGAPISGTVALGYNTATVTFTDSTWPLLENGTSFVFLRQLLRDDDMAAEFQIYEAMGTLLSETYGEKIDDAQIFVDKIYTAEEIQASEAMQSLNLKAGDIAFRVRYELHPAEGVDPMEMTAGTGDYDAETGWIVEKYNVGVLRFNGGEEPLYIITDFGTGF